MTTTSEPVPATAGRLSRVDQRLRRVVGIAAASYVGRLGSALAVVVTIPMARAVLAPDLFGVWMMLSGLLAFFAFADLGVGNGVLNRIAAAHARGDAAERRRTMSAGYACTGSVALLLVSVWIVWASASTNPTALVGQIVPEHRRETAQALWVFVVLLAVNIPASLIQKLQLGMQRGQWVGFAQFGAAVGTLVGVPLALHLDAGLPALVLASLGMQVFVNLVSTVVWYGGAAQRLPHAVRSMWRFEWGVVASLLRTGSMFLVLQLAAAFAFQSDAIVIVHRLGQVAYGDFAVVQRVFLAASSLLVAGLTGLWPAIGEALASGDRAWVRHALRRGLLTVLAAMGGSCLLLALLMPEILRRWVGMSVPPPVSLVAVLATWTVVEAMGNVSGAVMNAAGLLRPQVIAAAAMAAVAFAGKWFLVPVIGAQGATLATLCAYAAISVPIQIVILRHFFRAG